MVESSPPPEPKGIAGYTTPFPYMDRLQEKMEERLARKVPERGRFCGFCYARLRETEAVCAFCERPVVESSTVSEIPQEVLKAYKARQRTEAVWVYMSAFVGLIFASGLFIVLVLYGPGVLGHPALAFIVLIGGGYVLAQVTGPLLGGQVGYRRGTRKRDQIWAAFLRERDSGGG